MRVEGERERVHWSELGHQGRVGKEDEKERERRGGEKEAFHSGSHGIGLLSACGGDPGSLGILYILCVCVFSRFISICLCVLHVCVCVWIDEKMC